MLIDDNDTATDVVGVVGVGCGDGNDDEDDDWW